ncbi:ATP-binding protein [Mesorhizobium waimense]|nr:AAA family ATPase [Mesorhizobium waimense]
MRITAVFGISGVGKSRLIGQLAEQHDIIRASASALMAEAKSGQLARPVGSEELRTGNVVDNQAFLIAAFAALRLRESRDIVFDGHNVIDTDEGLVDIPFEVIEALHLTAIVVIVDDPFEIARRRQSDTGRSRPARTAENLANYQERVVSIARDYAARLSVPFITVRSGDAANFTAALVDT